MTENIETKQPENAASLGVQTQRFVMRFIKYISSALSRKSFSLFHLFFAGMAIAAIDDEQYLHAILIVIIGGWICGKINKIGGV
jgi:hypothetical protein